jgi:hypothetical protein
LSVDPTCCQGYHIIRQKQLSLLKRNHSGWF